MRVYHRHPTLPHPCRIPSVISGSVRRLRRLTRRMLVALPFGPRQCRPPTLTGVSARGRRSGGSTHARANTQYSLWSTPGSAGKRSPSSHSEQLQISIEATFGYSGGSIPRQATSADTVIHEVGCSAVRKMFGSIDALECFDGVWHRVSAMSTHKRAPGHCHNTTCSNFYSTRAVLAGQATPTLRFAFHHGYKKLYLQLHVRCCRLRGTTRYRIASGTAGVLWPVNWTVLRLLCTVCAASTSSRSCSCSWATIITSPRKHAQRPLRCIESTWSLSQVRARTPCFHSFVAMLLPGQRLHLRAPCLPVWASGCCTPHPA